MRKHLAYAGKRADGGYSPFHWNSSLPFQDVEISNDVFLIEREAAEAYKAGKLSPTPGAFPTPSGTGAAGHVHPAAAEPANNHY